MIADLFPVHQRGKATAIWALGPLIGPVAGPIAGGFVGEEIGWRWAFWIVMIAGGVMAIAIELLNQETCAPVIIKRKTARLSTELGRNDLRNAYETSADSASVGTALKHGLMRPILLFCKSPIVLLLSTYMVCFRTLSQ